MKKQTDSPARKTNAATVIIGILCLIGIPLWLFQVAKHLELKSPYESFVGHDTNYFAQVARACDSILEQNPLGTNWAKTITASDPTIPSVIQNLRPSHIEITSEPTRVFFALGKGRTMFGVAWEHRGTNFWILTTRYGNSDSTVYSETKQ